MGAAFVLGNGRSRSVIDLNKLRPYGKIYGCNALYREFVPDVLVAADRAISEQIQRSGYSQQHVFYTRKPISGLGGLRVQQEYWRYSSGPMALALSCIDRHRMIYMLGFDLGSNNDRFNNVYADTEFYKRSSDRSTYAGNWVKQVIRVTKDYADCEFVRVMGPDSAPVPEFERCTNLKSMAMEDFQKKFAV